MTQRREPSPADVVPPDAARRESSRAVLLTELPFENLENAWAVGDHGTSDGGRSGTLVLHWNGTAWSTVNSPSPGSGLNGLHGVSAVSGSDAWAVGNYSSYYEPYVSDTLILHWNGTAWTPHRQGVLKRRRSDIVEHRPAHRALHGQVVDLEMAGRPRISSPGRLPAQRRHIQHSSPPGGQSPGATAT